MNEEKERLQEIINDIYKYVEGLEDNLENREYYDVTRQAKRKILTKLKEIDKLKEGELK